MKKGKERTCESDIHDDNWYPCGECHLPGRSGSTRWILAEQQHWPRQAGHPVMHDSSRQRYLAFFTNSTSFVGSIFLMFLLLPIEWILSLMHSKLWCNLLDMLIILDIFGLLGAYAAGSNRDWKTSVYVTAIVFTVLAYFSVHVMISFRHKESQNPEPRNDNSHVG